MLKLALNSVRIISCPDSSERTAGGMRQCHVRTRNDAWTAHIRATLSIVKHLAIPSRLPSAQFSDKKRGVPRENRWCFVVGGRIFRGMWSLVYPGQRADQTLDRAQDKVRASYRRLRDGRIGLAPSSDARSASWADRLGGGGASSPFCQTPVLTPLLEVLTPLLEVML
jgi:hypothetical protein